MSTLIVKTHRKYVATFKEFHYSIFDLKFSYENCFLIIQDTKFPLSFSNSHLLCSPWGHLESTQQLEEVQMYTSVQKREWHKRAKEITNQLKIFLLLSVLISYTWTGIFGTKLFVSGLVRESRQRQTKPIVKSDLYCIEELYAFVWVYACVWVHWLAKGNRALDVLWLRLLAADSDNKFMTFIRTSD